MKKPILVVQTDFTYLEGAVASMYGVMKSVDPQLEIITATHEIPQYDIWSASYRLNQYIRFWPKGTIFVSVVDPGVGTKRKASIAQTCDGYFIVTPDNGTLTHVQKTSGIDQIRKIDESTNRLRGYNNERVKIFDGRDLFGYCAARLASGIISFEEVGPRYDTNEIVELQIHEPKISGGTISGIFEISDPNFGNLWTNIRVELFDRVGIRYGDMIKTSIRHGGKIVFDEEIPYFPSFGDARAGSVMVYLNEMNHIAMAKVTGNLLKDFCLGFGPAYTVEFTKI